MADPSSSPSPSSTMESHQSDHQPSSITNQNAESHQSDPQTSSSTTTQPPPSNSVQETPNSTTNPPSLPIQLPPPPAISPYGPPPTLQPVVPPPVAPPSFRPLLPHPQFTPLPNVPNLAYQLPPPGVAVQPPGVAANGAADAVPVSNMMGYQGPPGQQIQNPAMRPPYMNMPNGYAAMPMQGPQGSVPPGILRYPSPYAPMVRYPTPRPPGAMGMFPMLPRPPFTGIPGVRPFMPLGIRPVILPIVTPAEKPQTTVYIGKIATTVENDFMLALLRLCGPVKSWKRPQDSTNGTPKGFGFCEFESAEGVLRALRLLSKLNIDGQELVLNVNQATREYLERYVEKMEIAKQTKVTEGEHTEKEGNNAPSLASEKESKKDETAASEKETQDSTSFGIVTDEDKSADSEALEKLTNMIEERIKTRPLPPPPPLPSILSAGDITGNLKPELHLRDGDSDTDMMRNDTPNDKNDEDSTSENKPVNDHDKTEAGSPNRSKRRDRSRERERDRGRDVNREKDREFEKMEREAHRERERKERERDRKVQEAERAEREYKERVKEWESRERERERQRQTEKEREKERERKRKKEVKDDEIDDDDSRKRLRRSALEEKRRKRLREQDDDLEDKIKEDEEIAEALKRAKEEELREKQQQEEDALKLLSANVTHNSDDEIVEGNVAEQDQEDASGHTNSIANGTQQNGMNVDDDSTMPPASVSDMQQQSSSAPKKLGFGLVGSGKKTSVPSVFAVEEDDGQNDKKMRPLVPIDYSKEELQAVQPTNAETTPANLAAAAEFAKRLSNVNPKEDKPDVERERSRRSNDRSSHRDRGRDEDNRHRDDNRERNVDRERDRERGSEKAKAPDKKKLLDAKQLIDMIPKTKDELFSYEIDWAVYEKHELHKRMRPWISKKITEFLGEEETTLVDYIVSSTQDHVKASEMLELLQNILDDEAEMFVLKMWRMLIFEIKKVESGIASKS